MSIEKALKAKNPGVFIENLQRAYFKNSSHEILEVLKKPSNFKCASEIEIMKVGLAAWCNQKYLPDLKCMIHQCVEAQQFRSAMFGCMYLFGSGESCGGIELSEAVFSATEASSDYIFNVSSIIAILVDCSVSWKGAPHGKYFVNVDKNYISSTLTSVADDFRQSGDLFTESIVVDFASGFAKANQIKKSHDLFEEYINSLLNYDQCKSLIYSFRRYIQGIPYECRSITAPECDFVCRELAERCLKVAESKATKYDINSFQELSAYVHEFK